MVSQMNFELDFFKGKKIEYYQKLDYQQDIYIGDETSEKNIKNYWPTTIIKSNSEICIKVIYKIRNNDLRNKIKFIWLKVFWENYGHFGISNKKDCFLINLNRQKHKKKEMRQEQKVRKVMQVEMVMMKMPNH